MKTIAAFVFLMLALAIAAYLLFSSSSSILNSESHLGDYTPRPFDSVIKFMIDQLRQIHKAKTFFTELEQSIRQDELQLKKEKECLRKGSDWLKAHTRKDKLVIGEQTFTYDQVADDIQSRLICVQTLMHNIKTLSCNKDRIDQAIGDAVRAWIGAENSLAQTSHQAYMELWRRLDNDKSLMSIRISLGDDLSISSLKVQKVDRLTSLSMELQRRLNNYTSQTSLFDDQLSTYCKAVDEYTRRYHYLKDIGATSTPLLSGSAAIDQTKKKGERVKKAEEVKAMIEEASRCVREANKLTSSILSPTPLQTK